jgi:hypothetical protein
MPEDVKEASQSTTGSQIPASSEIALAPSSICRSSHISERFVCHIGLLS